MKFLLIVIMLVFSHFVNGQPETKVIHIANSSSTQTKSIAVSVKLSWQHISDTLKYVVIEAAITNISTDTIYYAHLKCNWTNSFIINSKAFTIDKGYCKKDEMEIEMLPPQTHIVYNLSLTFTQKLRRLKKRKYRIGFNLVTATNNENLQPTVLVIKEIEKALIVWSEPFSINQKVKTF